MHERGYSVNDKYYEYSIKDFSLEAISKMQITFKDKARADEKAEHTQEYVSILRRPATP